MPPSLLAIKCLFQLKKTTLSTEVVGHPYESAVDVVRTYCGWRLHLQWMTYIPAVNDERTSYRSVEAVHLAAEGEERVGVLRGASVRPTREVQLTDTSHLARLLQHGADPGNTRAWVWRERTWIDCINHKVICFVISPVIVHLGSLLCK